MISIAANIATGLLILALFISLIRLFIGDVPDKVVALNLIGMLTMGIALVFVFISDNTIYLDIALATILIVFAGTVIVARYLKRKTYDD